MYKYTHVYIVILSASSCFCYAGYELFQGFYVTDVDDTSDTAPEKFIGSIIENESEPSQDILPTEQNSTTLMLHQSQNTTVVEKTKNITTSTIPYTHALITKSTIDWLGKENKSIEYKDIIETTTLKLSKFECHEDERPLNIGPYEIPTQLDMVIFTKNLVLDMFNNYNKEAFYLLKDIRSATKATSSIEKKCKGNKMAYKQCVKLASRQCQQIIKNLVKALEKRKQEVLSLTNVKICKLSEMTVDPILILKSLAQEKVYLEFALPGFLRLLSACSSNCNESTSSYYMNKPLRHMTDQDLVIKHFLTRKNYLELIMDSRHKTTGNSN